MYRTITQTIYLLFLVAATFFTPTAHAQKKSKKKAKEAAAREQLLDSRLRQHVTILAHDSLEGRRTGTEGEQKAVKYIIGNYRQLGISGGNGPDYQQSFEVFEGLDYRKTSAVSINGQALKPGTDFIPFAWSAEGAVESETVVALNEGGEAWWIDADNIVEANKENPHFVLGTKLFEVAKDAAAKGARAVIFYKGGLDSEKFPKYLPRDRGNALSIPVWMVKQDALTRLNITDQAETRISAKIALQEVKRAGTNVVAMINNNAPLTIAIGAHLDHLGYGEDENSRYTGEAAIHNGADDNASGTAAVLELARLLKEKGDKRFNFLFLHFSGEELGLFGSKYFTEHPTLDLKKVDYMINLDMVGRLNDSSKALTIGGIGTSPMWPALVQPTADFTLKIDSSGTGPSDHTSFYRKDIPVLFFFTGLHTDYHKPSDDANLINYGGIARIVHFIEGIIEKSPADAPLAFTKTREQSMGTRGFKVSIGIMPDYTFSGTGVKADGLVDGRPAQKAGMLPNDVILQLGDYLITGMDTYMQALNRFEKGQTTTIVVKRDKEVLHLSITF